jgi:bla regulator protein blaR1
MRTIAIQQLFDETILRAFCWTLVHSLWQGLLMAILGGLLVLLTRKAAPALRYNLFSILFLLFFLTAGTTFVLELQAAGGGVINGGSHVEPAASSPVEFSAGTAATGKMASGNLSASGILQRSTDRFVAYFNEHAPFVVLIWFILFSAQLARLLANLGNIHRIRHYRTSPPSAYWKERIGELALLLGIKRKIALLESAIIRVPMMAGLFKPVILIPLGLLAQLPPDQVEAVLLHELAHIRRKDYLMNLMQSFGETLFFFNPGVRWISSLIREERENCCDDMALEVAKSKKEFIHALVSFQEYNMTASRYAIAFPGSGNHLLQRVRRIVYRDNKMLDIGEKCFLLACVFIIGGLTLAFSRSAKPSVPISKQTYHHPVLTSADPGPLYHLGRSPITDIDQGLESAIVQSSGTVISQDRAKAGVELKNAPVLPDQGEMKTPGSNRKAKYVTPILIMLLNEKIIRDTLDVSFDLCKRGMIVNGVHLSAAVTRPFQAQYITNPKNRIKYSKAPGGHESTSVTEIKE